MKVISRQDALAAGLKRYFTGKPCLEGHVAARYVRCNTCVACQAERNRKPEVKERIREYWQRPEVKERRREYWQRPEVKERARHRKYYQYGTIPSRPMPDFCEVRGCIPDKRGLVLDHDHKTGAFRGWACGTCNSGVGMLGDTVEGLMRAVEYLRRAGDR